MASDDKIQIEITLDDGKVISGFANIEKKAKDTEGQLEKSFGSGIFSKFNGGLVAAGAALAAGAAAFVGAFATIQKGVNEAINQENAINELNTSLALAGRYSQEASLRMQEFASSIQQVSIYGDDVVLRTSALIESLGKLNEDGLKRATTAALDLATSLRIDVNSAAALVGKAATGEVTTLSRYGITIKKTGDAAKDFATALTLIESKFGGASLNTLNTFEGATKKLNNSFGDFLEIIGNTVIKSPKLIELIRTLGSGIDALGKTLTEKLSGKDLFGSLLLSVIDFSKALNTYLLGPLELMYNEIKVVFSGLKTLFYGTASTIVGITSDMFSFFAPNSDTSKNLKAFAANLDQTFNESARAAEASVANAGTLDFTPKADEFLTTLKEKLQSATEITDNFKNNFTAQTEEIGQAMVALGKTLAQQFKQGIANTISQGIQTIVKGVVTGKGSFENFGKTMLGVIGQMAIGLGNTLILAGIGIESLKALSGAAAIAAGAGLVAIGAVLTAFSGSGETAGLTDTQGGALTGPGAASDFAGGEATSAPARPTNNISINIQGDVLDSEESGLRIVKLLQNEIDRSGSSVVTVA